LLPSSRAFDIARTRTSFWKTSWNPIRTGGGPLLLYRHIGFKDEPLVDAVGESDYNVLCSAVGGDFKMTESSCGFLHKELPYPWPKRDLVALEKWQQEGFDTHSVVKDLLFVDAASDDYRLKPDSPALKLGFEPIDQGKIGLRGKP